jgi:hypothetical protein
MVGGGCIKITLKKEKITGLGHQDTDSKNAMSTWSNFLKMECSWERKDIGMERRNWTVIVYKKSKAEMSPSEFF